jgi:hypothetical protein
MLKDILVSTTRTNLQLLSLRNSFRLVPKPRKLPWTNSIPKIIDDEYFWVEEEKSKNNEGKAINNNYKAIFKKEKLLYPTNYTVRERSYKENLLQPHKLDLTKENKNVITRMLKTPLNEL